MRNLTEYEVSTLLDYWQHGARADYVVKVVYLAAARSRALLGKRLDKVMDLLDTYIISKVSPELTKVRLLGEDVYEKMLSDAKLLERIRAEVPTDMIELALRKKVQPGKTRGDD